LGDTGLEDAVGLGERGYFNGPAYASSEDLFFLRMPDRGFGVEDGDIGSIVIAGAGNERHSKHVGQEAVQKRLESESSSRSVDVKK